jgi:diaminopimelate decarboxylase
VIYDHFDGEEPYKRSVLSDFQAPQEEAAQQFWASSAGRNLEEVFRATMQQVDERAIVGGVHVSRLATDASMRRERFQQVARSFLEQHPECQGTVTFLDLQAYAAKMRDVSRYLREPIFLKPGESMEQARQRMAVSGITGVDKILVPIKTLCEPIALLCQKVSGYGHDAASAGEMRLSASVGVSPRDWIISHPHKTPETLRMVCDPQYSPWAVTIDSREELDRLIKAGLSKDAVIFIRFKAKGANVVANLSAKFGMPVGSPRDKEKLMDLLGYARAEGFKEFGWAFHVGTQSANKGDYETALRTAYRLTELALNRKQPIRVTNFNIGGGICDERVATTMNTTGKAVLAGVGAQVAVFREMVEKLLGERVCIVAEPGRVTCAAAGFMMSQVLAGGDAQFTGARIRWATTKQGNLSGNVHDQAFFEIRPVHEGADAEMIQYEVHGSSNRPNDTFLSIDPAGRHILPRSLQTGDWLFTPEGGIAYGWDAAGSVDGIDPGRLIAFYTDGQGSVHFIESPWSERGKLRNRYLEKHLQVHKSAQLKSM